MAGTNMPAIVFMRISLPGLKKPPFFKPAPKNLLALFTPCFLTSAAGPSKNRP